MYLLRIGTAAIVAALLTITLVGAMPAPLLTISIVDNVHTKGDYCR